MSLLPARILDDYMMCRTRAYYTAHPESFKPRRIPDMEDSERRGRVFIDRYFIPSISKLSGEAASCKVLRLEDCNKENRVYRLIYGGLDKEIVCKPDLVSIVLLRNSFLRALVFEVGDTDVDTVLRRKHVLPRILLYMVSTYLYYGVPPVGFYISLSPGSSPPSIAVVSRNGRVGLTRILEEVGRLVSASDIPKPLGEPTCSHCVYASICKFAV